MKKARLLLMAAALLPLCPAWASSTYYARLTAQVSSASTGMGMVYAGTSDSAASWDAPSMSADNETSTQDQSLTFYAEAKPMHAGYEFVGWSDSDGETANNTDNPRTVTIKASSEDSKNPSSQTIYANFREKELSAFSVNLTKPTGGSYTIDGVSDAYGVKGPYTSFYAPELVATASSGYAFNGWYTVTDDGVKDQLIARETPYTPAFVSSMTVMADFAKSVAVTTFDALVASLAKDTVIEIPAGVEIVVPAGQSLDIGAGQTLIVNGTLFVEGALSVTGAIVGGGRVSTCKYAYAQKGQDDKAGSAAIPRNPYGTKKYWATAVATASGTVTGFSSVSRHVTVTNGKGATFRKILDVETPVAIICTVDASVAINHITGISDTSKTAVGEIFSTSLAQVALLTAKQTFSSTSADAGSEHGVIDGAGTYAFTYSPKNTTAGYKHTIVNGGYSCTVSSTAGGYYGNCSFYNCSSISIKNFVGKNSAAQLHIYDCTYTSSSISGFNEKTLVNGSVNFYSGGPYSTGSFKSGYEGFYHIYGGAWNKGGDKPAAERIATSMTATHKFYQHDDGCWYLDPKGPDVVTIDGGESYDDMGEAFAAVTALFGSQSSVRLTMEKDATVAAPITIPANKALEIELAGCCLTAAQGLAINHGTLSIGDKNANLKGTEGGRVLTTAGNLVENDGTVDVTYGYYTGDISLKGGVFVTHHGRFEGKIALAAGVDGRTAADLRGGYFAKDVTAFLREGYLQTRNYVGRFPTPDVTDAYKTSDGGYRQYAFQTLPSNDLALYNNPATSKDGYPSLADWQRRAEVMSMVQPWIDANYTVDIVAGFDRPVVKGSATAHITKPAERDEALDRDVGAMPEDLYRILSEYLIHPIIGNPADQKFYNAFLSDGNFKNVAFGISSATAANKGTTVNLRFDLCTGAVHTDITNLRSVYALMSEYFVIGAGKTNEAMIQPASGAATFYATVAEAIAACPDGGTVKLCNNVMSTDPIAVEKKSVAIDTNGMTFNGSIVPGSHCTLETTETRLEIEKYTDKVHRLYKVTYRKPGLLLFFD